MKTVTGDWNLMKRAMALVSAAVLVLVFALGCGRSRTYKTSEGEVKVTQKGKEVTIETKEGKSKVKIEGDSESATITTDDGTTKVEINRGASEKDVGIPLYPGATTKQTATMTQEGQGGFTQVILTTPDSVDKVKAFYQKQLPKAEAAMDMKTADGRMVHLTVTEGDFQKMIQISRMGDDAETQIVLMRGKNVD